MAEADARARLGAPLDADGNETGLAVIGMGKLGGEELNYSSDIDLMFVYGAEGETAGGAEGCASNCDYFARVCREVVSLIESVTEDGYVFRVDLRLRPEGRSGAVAHSLAAYQAYHQERAELWERQALLKARVSAGDPNVGARFMDWARDVVYRPGVDARILPAIRAMKQQIDQELGRRGESLAANVKLGRGGIREIEFIVQALQLLYGGDDPWLRERNSLKALFRLTERGYLAPDLGRALSHALVHLRTVEHRLQRVPVRAVEAQHQERRMRFPADAAHERPGVHRDDRRRRQPIRQRDRTDDRGGHQRAHQPTDRRARRRAYPPMHGDQRRDGDEIRAHARRRVRRRPARQRHAAEEREFHDDGDEEPGEREERPQREHERPFGFARGPPARGLPGDQRNREERRDRDPQPRRDHAHDRPEPDPIVERPRHERVRVRDKRRPDPEAEDRPPERAADENGREQSHGRAKYARFSAFQSRDVAL